MSHYLTPAQENVWLVGAGPIAVVYAKVLDRLGQAFTVIGRGAESAQNFRQETGFDVRIGGLTNALAQEAAPKTAIVAVSVAQLEDATKALIKAGTRKLLVEKPAGLTLDSVHQLHQLAHHHGAEVIIAYNRRFYASTLEAQKRIGEDGGVKSFTFDFTEWAHVIAKTKHSAEVKANWFLANSTHVVDHAFFLGGEPTQLHAQISGSLDWHPTAVFTGSGVTDIGACFSYHANWAAPGRWWAEYNTQSYKYIFRPMEQLHIQKIGSVAIEKIEIDDQLDQAFKPGFYRQTEAFLTKPDHPNLCRLEQHDAHAQAIYKPMLGG